MNLKYNDILLDWMPFLFIKMLKHITLPNKIIKLNGLSHLSELLESGATFSLFYKNVQIAFNNKRMSSEISFIDKNINYIREEIVYSPNYKPWKLPSGFLVTNEYTYQEGIDMIENGIIISDRLIDLSKLGNKCKSIGCQRTGIKFLVTIHKTGGVHIDLYDKDNMLMNIDHIHPKSKGGANHTSNYQLMCADCNTKKGNKILEGVVLKFDMFIMSL